MSDASHKEAQELLSPILDVFGGSDGGSAFAKLQHAFLPAVLDAAATNEKIAELVTMVRQFSHLCDLALKGEI